jgi:hypothetical protein
VHGAVLWSKVDSDFAAASQARQQVQVHRNCTLEEAASIVHNAYPAELAVGASIVQQQTTATTSSQFHHHQHNKYRSRSPAHRASYRSIERSEYWDRSQYRSRSECRPISGSHHSSTSEYRDRPRHRSPARHRARYGSPH